MRVLIGLLAVAVIAVTSSWAQTGPECYYCTGDVRTCVTTATPVPCTGGICMKTISQTTVTKGCQTDQTVSQGCFTSGGITTCNCKGNLCNGARTVEIPVIFAIASAACLLLYKGIV